MRNVNPPLLMAPPRPDPWRWRMACDKETPGQVMFPVHGDLCVTSKGQLQQQGQDTTWAGQGRAPTNPGKGCPGEQARAAPKCTEVPSKALKEPLVITDPCPAEVCDK